MIQRIMNICFCCCLKTTGKCHVQPPCYSFNTTMHILQLADLTLCHCLPHYKCQTPNGL
uniref:Uncharacterized protein n=1 Tax=Anguilla anguilla TaxID=7936 RepID=A0A0E9Y0X6_ANGAN